MSAGAVGAFIAFPIILNCGSIVAQPIGSGYAMAGIAAAFAAAIMVAFLRGMIATEPLHLVSPKSTYAAMIAALLAGVASAPGIHASFPDPESMAKMLFAVTFLCTALVGVFQLVLGFGKLGVLIKFIPYPVIAGFINGFSISLIVKQLPVMLGSDSLYQILAATHPAAMAVGLIAFAATLLATRLETRIPAALYGLVVGTASFLALNAFGDYQIATIGAIPAALPIHPQIGAMASLVFSPGFIAFFPDIIATAITITLIASLQSLISISGADALLGTRHDGNKELTTQGLGNLLGGVLGGMPTGGSPSVTNLVIASGGRSKIAYFSHAGTLLAMILGLGQIIGHIPLAVMAGVVVASLLHQMDGWSMRLIGNLFARKAEKLSSDFYFNLSIVAVVTALVFFFGALTALAGGMVLAFGAFVRQTSQSVVRRIVRGNKLHSRNNRPLNERKYLNANMDKVVVVEIQGAVFFGSVDQVVQQMAVASRDCRIVIIDMKRVTDIDSSGVVTLERLDKQLARDNCILYLSYLYSENRLVKALKELGFDRVIKNQRIFEDTNAALTAAEDFLLGEAGIINELEAEYPLEKFDILDKLKPEDIAYLEAKMKQLEFSSGMKVVNEGDFGGEIFFLASGRVTVSRQLDGRVLRIAGFRPGVSFGEMGLLTEGSRIADITADTPVVCYSLSREDFYDFCKTHPLGGQQILINMALALSAMVSSLSDFIRESEN